MKTIWKYDLEVTDKQEILIPKGSGLLTVATQYALPKLWALVDPLSEKVPVKIAMIGTGDPVWCEGWKYLGTFTMRQDALVFHVFVEIK